MTESTPRNSDRPAPRVALLLGAWRERQLRSILWAVAALGSVQAAISVSQFLAHQQRLAAGAALALLGLTWATVLLPLPSERLRAWLTLAVLYGATVISLVTTGLGAGGVMGVFGLVALAALLLGVRAAVAALGVAALSMAVAAFGFHHGWLQLPDPRILDATDWMNWLRVGSFGASLLAAVGGMSVSLLRELTKTLEERGELVTRLRSEVRERERANGALAEAQQRLIHAHKLEAVGRLAGGIAHDFNNTLTVILSYAEIVKKRLSDDRTGSELADQIVRAAEQGSDLTKQLLTFSRRQVVTPRTLDVQEVLRRTEHALVRLIPRTIRVHRGTLPDELSVRIDPTQLEQALLNLALNARDAMPEGGDLTFEAKSIKLTESDGLPLLPGPYVVISVRDTGSGMSEETRSRIFEPFFTTKPPGLGTGLGLSNVREAAEAAGGHVRVQSELGQGSEFALYLPRADGRVSGVEERLPSTQPKQASILVVDDEPQIRDVIGAILTEAGFEVHLAEGPAHALELARSRRFDLLWSDLVMPDVSGTKVIDEVLRLHPSTPVLVCSAFGTDQGVRERVARGELFFLSKPFTRKALIDAVERALETSRRGGSELSTPRAAG